MPWLQGEPDFKKASDKIEEFFTTQVMIFGKKINLIYLSYLSIDPERKPRRSEDGLEGLIWGNVGLGAFMEALGCRAVPSNRPQVCSISFDLSSFLTIARYGQTSFPNILSRRIQRKAITTEAQSLTKSYSAMAPEMVADRYSKSCQRTIL